MSRFTYYSNYVDGIIFGAINESRCEEFANLMKWILMMGELTNFLGLQIKQMDGGTFISQSKYTNDIVHNLASVKPSSTPKSTSTYIDNDEE